MFRSILIIIVSPSSTSGLRYSPHSIVFRISLVAGESIYVYSKDRNT